MLSTFLFGKIYLIVKAIFLNKCTKTRGGLITKLFFLLWSFSFFSFETISSLFYSLVWSIWYRAPHAKCRCYVFFSVALLVTDSIMFYSDYVIHYYHAYMSLFFISHCYSLSAASAFVFVSLHLWTLSLWIIVYHLCISWWRFDNSFAENMTQFQMSLWYDLKNTFFQLYVWQNFGIISFSTN